jgi:hypothetical protein
MTLCKDIHVLINYISLDAYLTASLRLSVCWGTDLLTTYKS